MTRILTATERSLIRGGIRSAWFRSELRLLCLKQAETATEAFKKDGAPKTRAGKQMYTRRYKCACCNKDGFKATDVQINHKTPIGGSPGSRNVPEWVTWDLIIERTLLCGLDNLEVLCKECHLTISSEQKKEMRDGSFYEKLKGVI